MLHRKCSILNVILYVCLFIGNSRYIRAPNSFIFSFKNKDGLAPFKSNKSNNAYAMYTNRYYGPTFGNGFDIYIASNAGSSSSSYTNFGYGYKLPSGYSAGNSKTRNLLPGSYRFTPNELEVYYFVTRKLTLKILIIYGVIKTTA